MAGFYNLDHKEVIRINVKKYCGRMQPENKKFSIDPQITSFEMLQGILARAFDINSDFTISYLARDSEGQTVYLSMLSDWDMDAAFQCAADPCLKLKVDLRPFEEEMEDWDVIGQTEIPLHKISGLLDKNSILGSITGTITLGLGKTVSSMQRVMGLKQADNEVIKPLKAPMSDMEFHNYLDSAGFMVKPNEFRLAIYQGGIEPSLRRVAWRHLLNVYPAEMSGKDRFDYMKRKEEEYRMLRDEWREKFRSNTATEEVKYIVSMVKKDVLRTDRSHGFYAGNDENENTLSLLHILVTYALTHPDVSYCQGMSDLASPLLVTQKDEGQAYVCFCALMNRLRENFTTEGSAIMTKFHHLSDLLCMYDPVLHTYLAQNSASDMFFCYRWFLLELKREFPFTDALYILEVMWATLPPSPPERELALVDSDYSSRLLSSSPCSPTLSFQHAMYAKLLAMRRVGARHKVTQPCGPNTFPASKPATNGDSNETSQNSGSLNPTHKNTGPSFDTSPGDGDDRGADFPEVDNPITRCMQQKSNSIDQVLQEVPASESDKIEAFQEENVTGQPAACNGDDLKTDSIQSSSNSSCDLKGFADPADKNYHSQVSSDHETNMDDSSRNQSTDSSSDFDDSDRRSSSDNSLVSDSTEAGDQQIQFTLSLDTNTNTNNRSEAPDLRNMASSTDSESEVETGKTLYMQSEIQSSDSSVDTNPGLFQSMKRFLASPKRPALNSAWQDSNVSPVSSPKKSSLANRHVSSATVLSPDSGKAEGITKNLSDSQIYDSHEASETFENTGSQNPPTSVTKPPVRDLSKLPPPQEFGAGNPFLMFMSLTLLIQHREAIIGQGMCYEEIAMHFDRLVRRHNANRVLHLARQMYTEYLRAQQANMDKVKETDDLGSSC